MEVVPVSNKPTQALAAAKRLLEIRDASLHSGESQSWIARAQTECGVIQRFREEGRQRLQIAIDTQHTANEAHIRKLLDALNEQHGLLSAAVANMAQQKYLAATQPTIVKTPAAANTDRQVPAIATRTPTPNAVQTPAVAASQVVSSSAARMSIPQGAASGAATTADPAIIDAQWRELGPRPPSFLKILTKYVVIGGLIAGCISITGAGTLLGVATTSKPPVTRPAAPVVALPAAPSATSELCTAAELSYLSAQHAQTDRINENLQAITVLIDSGNQVLSIYDRALWLSQFQERTNTLRGQVAMLTQLYPSERFKPGHDLQIKQLVSYTVLMQAYLDLVNARRLDEKQVDSELQRLRAAEQRLDTMKVTCTEMVLRRR